MLTQQFDRLSELEQELLIWLAIERQTVGPDQLQENIVRPISRRELLETLRNLRHRSLLEQVENGFTLQNVVLEFLTDYLIETVCQEIQSQKSALSKAEGSKIKNFNCYALLKAQTKEYIKSQPEDNSFYNQ